MTTKPIQRDDAKTGGGIGDIPAQPIDPAMPGTGDTDPRFDSSGVDTHPRGDEDNPADPRRQSR